MAGPLGSVIPRMQSRLDAQRLGLLYWKCIPYLLLAFLITGILAGSWPFLETFWMIQAIASAVIVVAGLPFGIVSILNWFFGLKREYGLAVSVGLVIASVLLLALMPLLHPRGASQLLRLLTSP